MRQISDIEIDDDIFIDPRYVFTIFLKKLRLSYQSQMQFPEGFYR